MIFYDIFVFFYFINEKKFLIKYFFIINVPINYPSLSKKCAMLSKNCPVGLKKSKKNMKNSEKSKKIPIFSLFFLWSQHTFHQK